LQTIGCGAFEEGIGEPLELEVAFAPAIGQPMVLIESDAGGEWKIGAHANEHSPPVPIVDVAVVLGHPAPYNEERPHSAIGNKPPVELIDRSVAHGPP
jgi:hypothetical protein